MICEEPIVHWMDIGIEEVWQESYATPLPSFAKHYDTKVFDTDRLGIFWGRPRDTVILRKAPPREWLEHLERSGVSIPAIVSLDTEITQFTEDHLNFVPRMLGTRFQPKLFPYAVTDAAYQISQRSGATLLGSAPAFTKEMSSKVKQRQVLSEAGIPTPFFKVFTSYDELGDYLRGADRAREEIYVLKYPYGASGMGMFILDSVEKAQYLERRLKTAREGPAGTALILERWHQTKADVSYQLVLQDNHPARVGCIRSQLLSGGVFQGFRYPALLTDDEAEKLRGLAEQVAEELARLGARAIVNIDAIVTRDAEVYPAIDINLRFSLATYFHPYLERLPPERCVKVRYYDLQVESVGDLVRVTESMPMNEGAKTIVASCSDACAKGLRRVFMLFEADTHARVDAIEESWRKAMSH
jgi:Phosphoribosylglycinamide synthetase, ATP-grasp (A) domain